MIDDSSDARNALSQLRAVILRLTLVSHAPAQSFNPAPPADPAPRRWRTRDLAPPVEHAGNHRPHSSGDSSIPASTIRQDDRQFDYRQKSHVYFVSRLNRWEQETTMRTVLDLKRLLKEAQETLEAWHRTPTVPGVQHDRDTFLWKCEVADATGSNEDICRKYGVSKRTLGRYRERYAGIRPKAA